MKQSQAHGKPNRANPPMDSQKKKKQKKTNTKSEIKLTHCTHSHVAAENTEKINPYSLYRLQFIEQKPYTVFIKKKKKKKNPPL